MNTRCSIALLVGLVLGPSAVLARSPCRYAIDVHFAANSATVGLGDVERIVDPTRTKWGRPIALYMVVGHADHSEAGDKALLSHARAAAVAAHVLRVHPELGSVTHIEAKGDLQPVGIDPVTNRRVEIEVVGCTS